MSREEGSMSGWGCLIVIVCFIIVFFLAGGIYTAVFNGIGPNYSVGARTGWVDKFSKKGLWWICYDGQLRFGEMMGNDQGNMWEFSCLDETVAKKIIEAQNKQLQVSLHYHQYWSRPISLTQQYVVDDVTVVERSAAQK